MKVVFLLAIIFSVFATNSAGPTPIFDFGVKLGLGPLSVGVGSGYRYGPYYGGRYYDRPYYGARGYYGYGPLYYY